MPSANIASATAAAVRAPSSPGNITGVIGCVPGRRSKPASVIRERNSAVLRVNASRRSLDLCRQLDRGHGAGDHRRSHGVGEQVGARALAQQVDDLLVRGDVTAGRAPQGLAQRAGEDVDAVDDVVQLRGSAAALADEADRMGVVHHDQGVVLLGEVADPVQRCEGPIHGEHAVGDDDPPASTCRRRQLGLQIGHVGIPVAQPLGLGQADAVNERGVVELVGDDCILGAEKGLEDTSVGVKA